MEKVREASETKQYSRRGEANEDEYTGHKHPTVRLDIGWPGHREHPEHPGNEEPQHRSTAGGRKQYGEIEECEHTTRVPPVPGALTHLPRNERQSEEQEVPKHRRLADGGEDAPEEEFPPPSPCERVESCRLQHPVEHNDRIGNDDGPHECGARSLPLHGNEPADRDGEIRNLRDGALEAWRRANDAQDGRDGPERREYRDGGQRKKEPARPGGQEHRKNVPFRIA